MVVLGMKIRVLMQRHLKILKWAIANACHWDGTVYSGAARGGHLEIK